MTLSTLPTPDAALPVGTRIGTFVIEALLASGDFGFVYRATDTLLLRDVALKEYFPVAWFTRAPDSHDAVADPAHAAQIATGRQAFLEEARLLSRLDIRGLLRVAGLIEAHGTVLRAMPFHAGMTLAQARRHGALDAAGLRSLLHGLLDPLEALHEANLVHGYLHPEQVLLTPGGDTLLLGFGTVRRALHGEIDLAYAPIEQTPAGGQVPRGAWTDLYALSAVAAFVLSGRPPPVGEHLGVFASAIESLGAPTAAMLERALSSNVAQRPQSVAAFRAGLVDDSEAIDIDLPLAAVAEPPATPPARTAPWPEPEILQAAVAKAEAARALAPVQLDPPVPRPGATAPVLIDPPLGVSSVDVSFDDAPATDAPAARAADAGPGSTAPANASAAPDPAAEREAVAPPRERAAEAARRPAPPPHAAAPAAETDGEVSEAAVRAAIAAAIASLPPPPAKAPAAPRRAGAHGSQPEPMPSVPRAPHASVPGAAPSGDPAREDAAAPARLWPWALAGLTVAAIGAAWVWFQNERPDGGAAPAVAAAASAVSAPGVSPIPTLRLPPPEPVASAAQRAPRADAPASAPPNDPDPLPAPQAGVPAPPAAPRDDAGAPAAAAEPPAPPPAAAANPPQARETVQAQRPARRPAAAPPAPATPREVCSGRTNFSWTYCVQTQCRRPQFAGHAQCRELRASGEIE